MTHPIVVEQLLFMLRAFLPRIGAADAAGDLKVEANSDTEHTISVGKTGICIDTCYPVDVSTLSGKEKRDGYRVFTMEVHPGGRWHPDEDVDVTRKETLSQQEVLLEVGILLCIAASDNLPDLPVELAPPVVAEEAAW